MISGLIIVGLFSHSLSVLAAGGDFIADSLAIMLGILAVHLRDKHGNLQATTYVALINGLLLLGITAFVLFQALHRLISQSPEIHGLPVFIIAMVSTISMVVGALILGRGAGNEDLHMRSVLIDTVSDGLSAAGVAVVGAIIFFAHGLNWLDAAAAILISVVIGFGAIRLLWDVIKALQRGSVLEFTND